MPFLFIGKDTSVVSGYSNKKTFADAYVGGTKAMHRFTSRTPRFDSPRGKELYGRPGAPGGSTAPICRNCTSGNRRIFGDGRIIIPAHRSFRRSPALGQSPKMKRNLRRWTWEKDVPEIRDKNEIGGLSAVNYDSCRGQKSRGRQRKGRRRAAIETHEDSSD